jgi:membrane-associated phospholipid phosphatase
VRLLRYPALVLNIAMALSAVPAANHYFVDVIAGCLVALVSIILVRFVTESRKGIFPEPMRRRFSAKKVNLSPE